MASDAVRGRFLWHELMTSDTDGATAFYSALAGWGTMPWMDGSYTPLFTMGDVPRAGMMALLPEMKSAGVPPHWLCYFGVADCDVATAEAVRLGATVVRPPADIPGTGRFSVVYDPQQAVFCLYTPAEEPASWPAPGLGDFTWHELATSDVDGAFRFYGALLGWTRLDSMDMGELGMYHMFGQSDGSLAGGIYLKPAEIPYSNWLPYACVSSADAAADVVSAKGGTILVPPMDVPGGDRITVLMDPQGAVFAVHAKGK